MRKEQTAAEQRREQEVSGLREKVDELMNHLEACGDEVVRLKEEMEDVEEECKKHEEEIADLQEQVNGLKDDLEEREDEVAQLEEELHDLQTEMSMNEWNEQTKLIKVVLRGSPYQARRKGSNWVRLLQEQFIRAQDLA